MTLSFWKRLFSADYRAAVSAEAAGQLEQAAEHYVLAGEHTEAARVHLARARRAENRGAEIDALRDALHWSADDQELDSRIRGELGRVLLARAQAEGVATARDQQRIREAAELLTAGGAFLLAGEALESIDDIQAAAAAYTKGGLLDRVERVLGKEDQQMRRTRALRDGFADYEMHLRLGAREAARDHLRQCVEDAENKAEYRRLLDELEARLITGGRVVLRRRQEPPLTIVGTKSIVMGRDSLCEFCLRAGGISRRHAEISTGSATAEPRFYLRDLDSRNGTRVGGMPIKGAVALSGTGGFDLGDHCQIEYEVGGAPPQIRLRVHNGLDQGHLLCGVGDDEPVDLEPIIALPVQLLFRRGRPLLRKTRAEVRLVLNHEPVAVGEIQLIHSDTLVIDGEEVDVP